MLCAAITFGDQVFVWNLDPTFFYLPDFIGGRGIRYYGVLYALALFGAFWFFQKQMERAGHPKERTDSFLTLSVIAVIAGARLGHCFFYEPARDLAEPITILYFWEGGLASHGSTIGLFILFVYFARREHMPIREVVDRVSLGVAWGAMLIRLGNFANSEIVGRVTDVAWKVKFPRHDRDLLKVSDLCGKVGTDTADFIDGKCYDFSAVPWRHPSQFYEALLGLSILIILLLVDRKFKEKRPLGLLGSLFLVLYFSGRFTVEYVKEFQTLESGLTMGQYLSIPFILIGLYGLFLCIKRPEMTPAPTIPQD